MTSDPTGGWAALLDPALGPQPDLTEELTSAGEALGDAGAPLSPMLLIGLGEDAAGALAVSGPAGASPYLNPLVTPQRRLVGRFMPAPSSPQAVEAEHLLTLRLALQCCGLEAPLPEEAAWHTALSRRRSPPTELLPTLCLMACAVGLPADAAAWFNVRPSASGRPSRSDTPALVAWLSGAALQGALSPGAEEAWRSWVAGFPAAFRRGEARWTELLAGARLVEHTLRGRALSDVAQHLHAHLRGLAGLAAPGTPP